MTREKNYEQASGLEIICPSCEKKTSYSSDNPYRPFCSQRCQTTDLAAWASEDYRVAGQALTSSQPSSFDASQPDDDDL